MHNGGEGVLGSADSMGGNKVMTNTWSWSGQTNHNIISGRWWYKVHQVVLISAFYGSEYLGKQRNLHCEDFLRAAYCSTT